MEGVVGTSENAHAGPVPRKWTVLFFTADFTSSARRNRRFKHYDEFEKANAVVLGPTDSVHSGGQRVGQLHIPCFRTRSHVARLRRADRGVRFAARSSSIQGILRYALYITISASPFGW